MSRLNACLFLCATLALTACSSAPPKAPRQTATPPAITTTDNAENLLEQANQSGSLAYAAALRLEATKLFISQGKWLEATETLTQISPQHLSPQALRDYIRTGLALATDQSNITLARQLLEQAKQARLDQTSIEDQIELTDLTASAYTLSNDHFGAARLRILNANLFSGDAYDENHEAIWKSLRQSPLDALSTTAPEGEPSYEFAGWLALARAIRLNIFSLDAQIASLFTWQAQWPDHPAALKLPGELTLMAQLPSLRPKHIALALPLTGKLANAGNAVFQGFMASYYRDEYRQVNETELTVIDTGTISDSYTLANTLEELAPDLVIGPLNKQWVEELANAPFYTRRTLALNYANENTFGPRQDFFEFGLAFEDEVTQIVQTLKAQGLHRLMLYCPDSNWGRRTCEQTQSDWQLANGLIVDQSFYNPASEHTKTIEESLKVNESKARKWELQLILEERPEFTPRRRQDLQAILLLADPVNGRQIKPLLSFYFAGDLPVYSLSTIYAGQPDTVRNQDLDGIYFTETPWALQTSNPLKNQAESHWPKLASNYSRLIALGADAYLLAPRLPLLEQLEDIAIPGNTGTLYTPQHRQIHRKMEWATFVSGAAQITQID